MVFLLAVLAAGCARQAASDVSAVDRDLLRLLPPEASLLAGARPAELLASPLYQKLSKRSGRDPLLEFTRETGLDASKDIDEFAASLDQRRFLMAVRGRFAGAKFEKLQKSSFGDATLWLKDGGGVGVVTSNLLVAGKEADIRAAIERWKAQAAPQPAAAARAASLTGKPQFWATGAVDKELLATLPGEGNMANFRKVAGAVDTFAVAADFRSGMALKFDGECATDADAKKLSETLRGFIGLGRLSAPENRPDLLQLFDAMGVTFQGKQVTMKADVPEKLAFEVLDRGMPEFRRPF